MTVKALSRDLVSLARLAGRRRARPLIAIWGNCQAEALRIMLAASPGIRERYDTVRLPGVHEVGRQQLPAVRMMLRAVSILIVQPIKEGYRGLPISTNEMLEFCPDARIIRFPSMYYTGLHPFLAYVHATGPVGTKAPLTSHYHDLRFIAAASGRSGTSRATVFPSSGADPRALRTMADESLAELRRRERDLDVRVADAIQGLGAESFWTVNHPSNAILRRASDQIHVALGIPPTTDVVANELLDVVTVPVHAEIREALGLPIAESAIWKINGRPHSDFEVAQAHLAFYRDQPDVLRVALEEHQDRLDRLGLA